MREGSGSRLMIVWCRRLGAGAVLALLMSAAGVPSAGIPSAVWMSGQEVSFAECGQITSLMRVQAAETRTKITDINLNISSSISAGSSGGNVSISTGDGDYRVGSPEVLNDDDDWKGGMTPRVSVELYANSGYYFSGSSKNMFSFSGDDASFVTARREDNGETLVLTIKLDKLDNGDLSVSGAYWSEGSGTANWDENSSAKYYQVKLYRDDSVVGSTRTTTDNSYEFAGSITRKGDYYFEVRAVGSSSEKGDWESSDTMYVTSQEAEDLSDGYDDSPGSSGGSYGPGGPGTSGSGGPGWNGGSYGPGGMGSGNSGGPGVSGSGGLSTASGNHWCLDQRGWWFQYSGGGYAHDGFQLIDGKWYFFDGTGYMRTGWISWQNKWYYCDSSGVLWMNVKTPDGYYVGGDGAWIQ